MELYVSAANSRVKLSNVQSHPRGARDCNVKPGVDLVEPAAFGDLNGDGK
jgi:hypothetical protein